MRTNKMRFFCFMFSKIFEKIFEKSNVNLVEIILSQIDSTFALTNTPQK